MAADLDRAAAGDAPGGPAADAPAPAALTVAVRTLCEFTARRGDLDRRFTPAATALEGIRGQQTVASRRAADYETEISLEGVFGGLLVRGRADGWDPRRRTLEEVKAVVGAANELAENRRALHWAQLQCYGALFCRDRGLDEVALALVYFDVTTQTETELREVCGADDLVALLEQRCAAYAGWARQEATHRAVRDAALAALPFPPGDFRPGQRRLAEAVYRATLAGRALLAQAPTGIGKTIGTLFPALRAMPAAGVDQLAFLTCKGTGRIPALEALDTLRAVAAGGPQGAGARPPLRVTVLVPKDEGCEHPGQPCHPEACPLARGFFDRLPAARAQAVAAGGVWDAAAQRRIALEHGICPYHFGHELARWADVCVGDVHHLFDPGGLLWGLAQALERRLAVLVDEAHNLLERTRAMYGAELRAAAVQAAARRAPAAVAAPLRRLAAVLNALAGEAEAAYTVLDSAPDAVAQALQQAAGALSEHFRQQPLATGPLLEFHFTLQRFARRLDTLGEHSLLDLQTAPAPAAVSADEAGATGDGEPGVDALLTIRNVAPAPFLRPRFAALHGTTLFSATLAPPEHAMRLLGLPEDTRWLDLPPAFPPEHLVVRVASTISTRYADRERSLPALLGVLARQFDAHPGNYLAFFSSFEYLARAADALARARPDIPQWRQQRAMDPPSRSAFLARFEPAGRGIGFAVLGGAFAEGVDLPGTRLVGAFVATLALPPVSPVNDALRDRLAKLLGEDEQAGRRGTGLLVAELVPAMQKVVQAAGRVLRTPEDRGWLWLLDDRYARPEVQALLPAWWGLDASPGSRRATAGWTALGTSESIVR